MRKLFIVTVCLLFTLSLVCFAAGGAEEIGEAQIRFLWSGDVNMSNSLEEAIKAFEDLNPNIDVVPENVPPPWENKTTMMLTAGTAPDVIWTPLQWGLMWGPFFMDLKDFVKKEIDTSDWFPYTTKLGMDLEGNQVWIPLGAAAGDIWFYNKDLFKEAGLEDPNKLFEQGKWDIEHFVEAAKKISLDKDKDGKLDQWGYGMWNARWEYWRWMHMFGGSVTTMDLRTATLETPEVLEALTFLRDLRHKHNASPTIANYQVMDMLDMFMAGRIGMTFGGMWTINRMRENAKFDWDVAPIPMVPGGYYYLGKWATGGASINKDTKFPKAALAFVKFLASAEGQKITGQFNGTVIQKVALESVYKADPEGLPPEHMNVFAMHLKLTSDEPDYPDYGQLTSAFGQIATVLGREVERSVWLATTPIEGSMKIAQKEVQEILDEYWKEKDKEKSKE